jgi:uncharacterized protein (DUF1330 family)
MAKAYLIGQVTVHNPEGYTLYSKHVPATLAQYGGKYLVRGGDCTQLEGNAQGNRRVVIEFASRAAAETWYNSPEYQAIVPHRKAIQKVTLPLWTGLKAKIQPPPP